MSEQEVIKQTRHYLMLASEAFGKTFDVPEISFKLAGKAAGYFKMLPDGSCLINYNKQLLELNKADYLQNTVPHEVAHLVAYRTYGRKIKPHGKEWKSVMALFKADDSRCHDYDLSEVSTRQYRRFLYQCSCRSHQLTSIRHNRVMSGQRYICRQCNQPLSYQEQV